MADDMNCASCKWNDGEYVLPTSERPVGLRCVRHAPIVTGGVHGPAFTAWPCVRPDDTCGDFQWPEDNYVPVPF